MIDTRAGEIEEGKEDALRVIPITARNEIEQAGAKFSLERINAAHIESIGCLEEEKLTLKITDAFLEDFAITRVQLSTSERVRLHWSQEDAAAVKIFLVVQGQITLKAGNQPVAVDPDHLNMIYKEGGTVEVSPISKSTDLVLLHLSEVFIKTLIPQTEHDLCDTNTSLKVFFESGYRHAPALSDLISQILAYTCPEYLKRIHLQSKITELFFQLMLAYSEEKEHFDNRPVHIEKQMYEARKQILEHIRKPYTLKILARTIGTNEYELKRNFKQTFGITVFGYIHEVRMQRAQKYLKNTALSIAQIADKIGYKNPQHFSTAFKKSTGCTPSTYRLEN